MDFAKALEAMKQGKKVKRNEWLKYEQMKNKVMYIEDGIIWETIEGFADAIVSLSSKVIMADDWIEIEENLLTENEKEFLDLYTDFNLKVINAIKVDGVYLYFLAVNINNYMDQSCIEKFRYDKTSFKKLELNKVYTLEELGI